MMLFNKTEGLFCHRTQDESMNSARDLHFNPLQIHSFLPAEVALAKGAQPRSNSRVYVNGNEARVLSPENSTLVLVHPELKPVLLDGKAITVTAESKNAMSVELTRGWHSIEMQSKNGKSDKN